MQSPLALLSSSFSLRSGPHRLGREEEEGGGRNIDDIAAPLALPSLFGPREEELEMACLCPVMFC